MKEKDPAFSREQLSFLKLRFVGIFLRSVLILSYQ